MRILVAALGLSLSLMLGGPAATQAVAPAAQADLPARFEGDDLVLGSPAAPVTVVEYLSGTCPYCAAFDRDVFPHVASRYIATGKIRYVLREVPTAPTEVSAAGFLLARCAGADRYLSVIEDMFRNRDSLVHGGDTRLAIIRIGARAGLSVEQMQACIDDDVAFAKLNDRMQAALALGVSGTPTFLFNGIMLKAGDRIGRSTYLGGGLTADQFDAAYRAAMAGKGSQ